MDDQGRRPLDVTLDPGSAEAEQAARAALRLVRARAGDPDAYARELEEVLQGVIVGIDLDSEAAGRELADRVAHLVEALAALTTTTAIYAAEKLGIDRNDLLGAIGETLQDVRRGSRR